MPPKLTGKIIGLIVAAVVLVAMLAAIIIMANMLRGSKGEAKQAEASENVAEAAVDAGAAATGVIERHYDRFETRVEVHKENADAILAAPGAADQLDPGFLDALCDGLRRHESGRHSCDQVQPVHPELVADPG